MEMGGVFFKNMKLYAPPHLPPPTIRFGRVLPTIRFGRVLTILEHYISIFLSFPQSTNFDSQIFKFLANPQYFIKQSSHKQLIRIRFLDSMWYHCGWMKRFTFLVALFLILYFFLSCIDLHFHVWLTNVLQKSYIFCT